MALTTEQIAKYMNQAHERLHFAYAPYSQFHVSSLLLLNDGSVFSGVNIENVSFGATLCAERVAMVAAINAGYRRADFAALFVVARTKSAITPCCLCRQLFVEFFDKAMPIYLGNDQKETICATSESLVPYAFESLSM